MVKITKPTIILDKEKCIRNLTEMQEKAANSNVLFRPHFKTHQSAMIGNWFRKHGIHSITVSTVSMAKYFSNYGWKDITISVPVNILEAWVINELAVDITLNLVVESLDTLKYLDNYLTHKVGIFIEIDTGYHRSGIDWKDFDSLEVLLEFLSTAKRLYFKGIFTHAGHTYHVENPEEVLDIYKDTILKMNYIKDKYLDIWPELVLSVGDTPASSLISTFEEVDEIRPGNFIFYDLMQYSIGACSIDQIAMAVACPVIAKNPERNEIVIYGGAVHLSKDFLYRGNGERIYGYIVRFNEKKWSEPVKGTFLFNLTQDHGIIRTSREIYDEIKHGDILGVLPVHSCLTANLMKSYTTLDGENIDY